jgi:hypothetical protein
MLIHILSRQRGERTALLMQQILNSYKTLINVQPVEVRL